MKAKPLLLAVTLVAGASASLGAAAHESHRGYRTHEHVPVAPRDYRRPVYDHYRHRRWHHINDHGRWVHRNDWYRDRVVYKLARKHYRYHKHDRFDRKHRQLHRMLQHEWQLARAERRAARRGYDHDHDRRNHDRRDRRDRDLAHRHDRERRSRG